MTTLLKKVFLENACCGFNPFSAVVRFQKQFTDDVAENVKKGREQLNQHHRDMHIREIELHLDHLEEQFLCCVCGTQGEVQDDLSHELVQPFKLIQLPPREEIERRLGIAPETRDGAAGRRGSHALLEVVAPVSSFEVSEFLTNVQSYVVYASAAAANEQRMRSILKHFRRDKGLVRIEDVNVDIFSQFFQRPVRGFLCEECYASAKRRLDTLREQIKQILRKGEEPFAATGAPAAAAGEVRPSGDGASESGGQHRRHHVDRTDRPLQLVHSEYYYTFYHEGGGVGAKLPPLAQPSDSSGSTALVLPGEEEVTGSETTTILSRQTIITLRELVRCGVCQRRQCRFFEPTSMLFLCQFCTARDRFYRDHAACINEEPMRGILAHLLTQFAQHSEHIHREREELRQQQQQQQQRRRRHARGNGAARAESDLLGPHGAPGAICSPESYYQAYFFYGNSGVTRGEEHSGADRDACLFRIQSLGGAPTVTVAPVRVSLRPDFSSVAPERDGAVPRAAPVPVAASRDAPGGATRLAGSSGGGAADGEPHTARRQMRQTSLSLFRGKAIVPDPGLGHGGVDLFQSAEAPPREDALVLRPA